MDPQIRHRFSPQVFNDILSRYGIDPSDVTDLGGFENFVYRCVHEGSDRILRISHSIHRSADAVAAEISWVNWLSDLGIRACRAIPESSGKWLKTIEDREGDYFTAALFEAAPGSPAEEDSWQPPIFEKMGRMMGQMHALTKNFQPEPSSPMRPDWYTETADVVKESLPGDEEIIIRKFDDTIAAIQTLPKNADSYGLVHLDFHRGNFFVHEGNIHLFDFDDFQYSWFVDDIAMALFYAVPPDGSAPETISLTRTFLRSFLIGYRKENKLAPEWFSHLPLFLKRREILVYTIVKRSELKTLGPWTTNFMKERADRIEHERPFIEMDFTQFTT